MRRRRFPSHILLIGLLVAPVAAQGKSAPSAKAAVQRAAGLDEALRKDERKLKFRHHTMRVIKAWAAARKTASGNDRLERRAAEGEARAWKLLAHWSGRRDDRRRAAALAEALRAPAKSKTTKPKRNWLASVNVTHDEATVSVGFDLPAPVKIERETIRLKNQRRVYFDVTPAVASKAALGSLAIKEERIARARVGQFDADTVRVVFDVSPEHADALQVEDGRIVFQRPSPKEEENDDDDDEDPRKVVKRLEIALRALTDDATKNDLLSEIVDDVKAAYPDVAAPQAAPEKPAEATVAQKVAKKVAKVVQAVRPPKTKLKRSTREAAKPRSASLLAVRRIIVDPGHGGKDHGATGPRRVREKDVNLAISKRLAKTLRKRLGVEVVLTRTKDEFISLRRRSQIANRAGGDLFISIHANANRSRRVHGIETYHLNVTSNRYAKRLARRENLLERGAGDVPEPHDHHDGEVEELIPEGAAGQDLRLILADLAMRSATVESKRLAGYVQSSLVGSLRRKHDKVKDLGVKHALFYVLLGVRMPAVLIETGFVSNKMESQRLANPQYQAEIADAITAGVERFVRERQRLAGQVATERVASL